MSKVEVSKAELALWGIEHLTKFKKKQGQMLKSVKEETATTAKKVAGVVPGKEDIEDCNWKREILEGRKRRHEQQQNASQDHAQPPTSDPDRGKDSNPIAEDTKAQPEQDASPQARDSAKEPPPREHSGQVLPGSDRPA
ncbi:hypothetical protein BV20DRAFT_260002 [Pilatotrama ljubarskyi]|nr:hypothetical protein BV20DRAFT_260002 [Pilatotrama ljubarskyi]